MTLEPAAPAGGAAAEDAAAGDAAANGGARRTLHVLLLDDKLLVREGVRALLDREPGLVVVGEAGTLAEAVAVADDPDVVVVDLVLPDARGSQLLARVCARFPATAVVVLTDVETPLQIQLALAAGARAYVAKRATPRELVAAIRAAAAGRRSVHPSLPVAPVAPVAGGADDGELLNRTERDVVRLLVLGHTNAEIAELCAVSLRTVEARRARVLRKLGVRTRAELVRVAHRYVTGDVDLT